MLLYATKIVNSTPLWHTDSPTEPEPISPHMLLTQRDDGCTKANNGPNSSLIHQTQNYGQDRWSRIGQLQGIFWNEWQNYIFRASQEREKWTEPRRNAQEGDMVLLCDKNLPRLQWATGKITKIKEDKDGLVRTVTVQPFSSPDRPITEAPRERSIHDLVLVREDSALPDLKASTTQNDIPQGCLPPNM